MSRQVQCGDFAVGAVVATCMHGPGGSQCHLCAACQAYRAHRRLCIPVAPFTRVCTTPRPASAGCKATRQWGGGAARIDRRGALDRSGHRARACRGDRPGRGGGGGRGALGQRRGGVVCESDWLWRDRRSGGRRAHLRSRRPGPRRCSDLLAARAACSEFGRGSQARLGQRRQGPRSRHGSRSRGGGPRPLGTAARRGLRLRRGRGLGRSDLAAF
mmetsp:Transcript_133522/g.337160  ORF Transcript_133522/g.337160 Transcript_133522/m.337160 type:complete len:215 (-) Transcript_133522:544-1188(-)